MGTTAGLGLPYPDDVDHVIDGAAAMQALAEALDTALGGLMRLLGGTSLDSTGISATDWTDIGAAGTFTAPASGRIVVSLSGYFSATSGIGQLFLGFRLATGGSTTVAADGARALKVNVDAASSPQYVPTAFGRYLVTGLTPGASYDLTMQVQSTVPGAGQGLSAVVEG